MITAVRYVVSPDRALLQGPPLAQPVRVFYDLPCAEVRARLERALRERREGVSRADVTAVDAGRVREAVLERLFPVQVLERAFVGTEAVAGRRAR